MQGWWLLALGAVAFLYGAVGHAGASDYIAVLALAGLPAEQIKPLALILNTVVAAQGRWQFVRAGHLRWRLFWPVLLAGLPMAFLGGWLDLPTLWFQRLVALVLLASASPVPAAACFSRPCCCVAAGPPPARRQRCRRCSSSATLSAAWPA